MHRYETLVLDEQPKWDDVENETGDPEDNLNVFDETPSLNWSPRIFPESIDITLPSTLGQAYCEKYGLQTLAEQELKLRQGQANDALHQIQLALVHKSYIF